MKKPKTGNAICDALDALFESDAIAELAHRSRAARHVSEAAAVLDRDAVVHLRASEGFSERRRYDLAAGERERAAQLEEIAAAVRTLDAYREELRKRAEQPPVSAPNPPPKRKRAKK